MPKFDGGGGGRRPAKLWPNAKLVFAFQRHIAGLIRSSEEPQNGMLCPRLCENTKACPVAVAHPNITKYVE